MKDEATHFGEVKNGKMVLDKYCEMVKRHWRDLPKHHRNCELDWFIIMPNHMHGIVVIREPVGTIHELSLRRNMTLPKVIGRFKMQSAKEVNMFKNTSGQSLWQRSFYDRVIRNEKELFEVRKYIKDNPLKWEYDCYYIES